jgi:hypothetical protein
MRERFVLAGPTERFDESLLLLRRTLGWRRIAYGRVDVAPRGSAPVDPAAADVIRERNQLDVELHRFFGRLLEEDIGGAGPSFVLDLACFRQLNQASGLVLSGPRRVRSGFVDSAGRARALIRCHQQV